MKRNLMADIARMHGIPMTVITPKPKDAGNIPALEERIAKALTRLPRPCGVFAVTDMIGATAVSAAVRIGAKIPEDFAIISVDDDPEICESCSPTLSSVRDRRSRRRPAQTSGANASLVLSAKRWNARSIRQCASSKFRR